MREKPILFNGEMVRAILDGRKTQTRRVMKPQPELSKMRWNGEIWQMHLGYPVGHDIPSCPYGNPGDRLWVRETHSWITLAENEYVPSKHKRHHDGYPVLMLYRADRNDWGDVVQWRPSIHMPRWASRIMLRVTDVRVQPIKDISEYDILAEGIGDSDRYDPLELKEDFVWLWESINAKRGYSWDTNPWVWVIEFEAVTP